MNEYSPHLQKLESSAGKYLSADDTDCTDLEKNSLRESAQSADNSGGEA
ncbi:MAG TPA: hypothetical protein PK441_11220 [Burkholderiaceae bacterium]|jgi:hypothetical protein|nr:hypothetical protein [Thermotogaceae bacterium]HNZ91741.1 hypothetical protein [Acidovorax sp.]HOF31409.1 hypothetical protein [Burkholderiaceae bacterium]HON93739.1 hypothetical protein [Sedimentisphaerales bacterium]HRV18914.1 hypothetical protein [Myxococcota bacterium]